MPQYFHHLLSLTLGIFFLITPVIAVFIWWKSALHNAQSARSTLAPPTNRVTFFHQQNSCYWTSISDRPFFVPAGLGSYDQNHNAYNTYVWTRPLAANGIKTERLSGVTRHNLTVVVVNYDRCSSAERVPSQRALMGFIRPGFKTFFDISKVEPKTSTRYRVRLPVLTALVAERLSGAGRYSRGEAWLRQDSSRNMCLTTRVRRITRIGVTTRRLRGLLSPRWFGASPDFSSYGPYAVLARAS